METYYLYNMDTLLGSISYDKETYKYTFIKSKENVGFPPSFSKDPFIGNVKDEILSKDVHEFVINRITPKRGKLLDIYFKLFDLGYYGEWELFVSLSGMSETDFYWINSCGAKSFKDHILKTGKLPCMRNVEQ